MAITLSFLALMISLVALRAVSQSNQLHKALMRSEGEREQLELTICSLIDGDGEVVNLALPAASKTARKIREEAQRAMAVRCQQEQHLRAQRAMYQPRITSSVDLALEALEAQRLLAIEVQRPRHRGGKQY